MQRGEVRAIGLDAVDGPTSAAELAATVQGAIKTLDDPSEGIPDSCRQRPQDGEARPVRLDLEDCAEVRGASLSGGSVKGAIGTENGVAIWGWCPRPR